MQEHAERETLKEEMGRIVEEARMVLPGIQALFGFQAIAVFNERFKDLPMYVQDCHVAALAFVVVAIALIMMPAAYHRLAEPGCVSRHAIKVSSLSICFALAPLAAALSLDIFVVTHAVTESLTLSLIGGGAAFSLLIILWFLYPLYSRHHKGRGMDD